MSKNKSHSVTGKKQKKRRNLVAKRAYKYNKSLIHADQKKKTKAGYTKHRGEE